MITKIGKIFFIIHSVIDGLSKLVRKDKNAYNHSQGENVEQIKINEIENSYILEKKGKIVYISTAYPLIKWSGLTKGALYFTSRVPIEHAKNISNRMFWQNNSCSSGVSISIKTDSNLININVWIKKILYSNNMPLQSIAGIDIYEKKDGKRKWLGCYTPKTSFQNKIYCKLEFEEKKEREICIYLPNFSQIQLIEIGMVEDATLYSGKSRIGNPIAIYGSSVTQGCASSRPALSYANLLAWKTGKEVLNFGFSGSARGEIEIAKYIGTIPLDGIILEYDHNVSVDELKETHYKFYKELRRQQKKTPIILFSRTSGGLSVSSDEERERYCVIKRTFTIARNSGDMNIYLVRGNEFFEEKEIYFVDDRHPNDFGMFKISQNLANVWREIY